MLFSKKLFLLVGGSSGLVSLTKVSSSKLDWFGDRVSSSDLAKILKLTKNVKDVKLSPFLDSNITGSSFPYLYSLFSTNLETFTDELNKNFYPWFLYEWANWFLERTDSKAFIDTKLEIVEVFKKAEEKYKPNAGGSGTPFDSKHWTKENHIITESKDGLENIFLKFFFKSFYLDDSKNGFEISSSIESQLGDKAYASAIVDFQKFVFNDWKSNQKPVLLCKKEWNLSEKFNSTEKIFKDDTEKDHKPSKPTIDWPDFYIVKDELITFSNGSDCDGNQLLTLDELSKLEGREIDAFVANYFDQEIEKASDIIVTQANELTTISNIYELFLSDDKVGNLNYKVNESVIDDNGILKNKKNSYLLSFRQVKFNNEKKGIFIKTKKGITFLLFDDKSKNVSIDKALLKNQTSINGFSLETQLQNYFKKRSLEILGRYFSSKAEAKGNQINTDNSEVLFGKQLWLSQFRDLLIKSSSFVHELRKNKENWESTKKLSAAVKDYGSITYDSNKKLTFSAGLAVPTFMPRNLDNKTSIIPTDTAGSKKASSSTTENTTNWLSSIKKENDGLFPWLNKYYSVSDDKTALYKTASDLKKAISDYLNAIKVHTVKSEQQRTSFFFKDYVLDNIYGGFITKDSGEFLKKATVSLMLSNEMRFKFENNDLSGFVSNLNSQIAGIRQTESQQLSSVTRLNSLLEESIKDIYYGSSYLSEPLENRLNYGGFKYSEAKDQNKDCFRSLKTVSATSASTPSPSTTCTSLGENKKEWLQKVSDYWSLKNYVFSADGYELGSHSTNNYIKFLFSLYSFSKNNFSELRNFVSGKIPTGRYGALVWVDHVSSSNNKVNSKNVGAPDDASKTLDELTSYFRRTKKDEIFHPFFSSKIEAEETKTKPTVSGHIGAYAKIKKEENEYLELYGFQGLVTERLNLQGLPEEVKKAIFVNFKKANPKDNKNYSSSDDTNNETPAGLAYGIAFSDDVLEELIDSFKNIITLKNFLKDYLSDVSSTVLQKISSDSYKQGSTDKSLSEIKKMFKDEIQKLKSDKKFKTLIRRFSGFLQNPNLTESVYWTQKFYIPDTDDKSNGFVVYITQINKHDFGDGFNDFVKEIDISTFIKMVTKLSTQQDANSSMVNGYLISKKVFI